MPDIDTAAPRVNPYINFCKLTLTLTLTLTSWRRRRFASATRPTCFFYSSGNEGLSWICFEQGSCSDLAQQAWGDRGTTLHEATSRSQAPIAARVASRDRGYAAPGATGESEGEAQEEDAPQNACRALTPELQAWLRELDGVTR